MLGPRGSCFWGYRWGSMAHGKLEKKLTPWGGTFCLREHQTNRDS